MVAVPGRGPTSGIAWQAGDVRTGASNQGALDHDDRPALLREVPCEVLARLAPTEDGILNVDGVNHG